MLFLARLMMVYGDTLHVKCYALQYLGAFRCNVLVLLLACVCPRVRGFTPCHRIRVLLLIVLSHA